MTRLNLALICVSYLVLSVDIAFAQNDFLQGGTIRNDSLQQGGTVRGQIVDTTIEQNPIEGVRVIIVATDDTEFTTTTDTNGDFEHAGIPAGRYLISIYKDGYGDRVRAVILGNGGHYYVPLKMTKKNTIVDFFQIPVPMYWVLILCVIIAVLIFARTNR